MGTLSRFLRSHSSDYSSASGRSIPPGSNRSKRPTSPENDTFQLRPTMGTTRSRSSRRLVNSSDQILNSLVGLWDDNGVVRPDAFQSTEKTHREVRRKPVPKMDVDETAHDDGWRDVTDENVVTESPAAMEHQLQERPMSDFTMMEAPTPSPEPEPTQPLKVNRLSLSSTLPRRLRTTRKEKESVRGKKSKILNYDLVQSDEASGTVGLQGGSKIPPKDGLTISTFLNRLRKQEEKSPSPESFKPKDLPTSPTPSARLSESSPPTRAKEIPPLPVNGTPSSPPPKPILQPDPLLPSPAPLPTPTIERHLSVPPPPSSPPAIVTSTDEDVVSHSEEPSNESMDVSTPGLSAESSEAAPMTISRFVDVLKNQITDVVTAVVPSLQAEDPPSTHGAEKEEEEQMAVDAPGTVGEHGKDLSAGTFIDHGKDSSEMTVDEPFSGHAQESSAASDATISPLPTPLQQKDEPSTVSAFLQQLKSEGEEEDQHPPPAASTSTSESGQPSISKFLEQLKAEPDTAKQ